MSLPNLPGWSRAITPNGVVYTSPSGVAVACLSDLHRYLVAPNSCKCGLPCPLLIDDTFNFDARIRNEDVSVSKSRSCRLGKPAKQTKNSMTKVRSGLSPKKHKNPNKKRDADKADLSDISSITSSNVSFCSGSDLFDQDDSWISRSSHSGAEVSYLSKSSESEISPTQRTVNNLVKKIFESSNFVKKPPQMDTSASAHSSCNESSFNYVYPHPGATNGLCFTVNQTDLSSIPLEFTDQTGYFDSASLYYNQALAQHMNGHLENEPSFSATHYTPHTLPQLTTNYATSQTVNESVLFECDSPPKKKSKQTAKHCDNDDKNRVRKKPKKARQTKLSNDQKSQFLKGSSEENVSNFSDSSAFTLTNEVLPIEQLISDENSLQNIPPTYYVPGL